MRYRNRGLRVVGALTAALLLGSVGTAAASSTATTPDLSFAAFGTGSSPAAASQAAYDAALSQQAAFSAATGAVCTGPVDGTLQNFQLVPSGYGAAVTLDFECGAPTISGPLNVMFSGFGTGASAPDAAGSAIGVAYRNETAYLAATGVTCVDSPQPDTAQFWQVTTGYAAIGKDADTCQAP